MRRRLVRALGLTWALLIGGSVAGAAQGERVTVTGEFMDSWCYLSQVMGPSEATLGTAHHQCAVWCAAGGIPVGLIDDAGEIYFVLKVGEETTGYPGRGLLEVQSHRVTVEGELYERDGLKYLLVSEVVDDQGIVNVTHDDFGVVPAFGVPKQ